jgi:hypothetical protein
LPAESLAVLDAQLSALLLTLENAPEQPR